MHVVTELVHPRESSVAVVLRSVLSHSCRPPSRLWLGMLQMSLWPCFLPGSINAVAGGASARRSVGGSYSLCCAFPEQSHTSGALLTLFPPELLPKIEGGTCLETGCARQTDWGREPFGEPVLHLTCESDPEFTFAVSSPPGPVFAA